MDYALRKLDGSDFRNPFEKSRISVSAHPLCCCCVETLRWYVVVEIYWFPRMFLPFALFCLHHSGTFLFAVHVHEHGLPPIKGM